MITFFHLKVALIFIRQIKYLVKYVEVSIYLREQFLFKTLHV